MAAKEILKRIFGHDAFRDGQEELVNALLSGRDALGIMPTGAGKSICYQVPALSMEGVALVISPLISLMKDQVAALKASGVAAGYINSSLTPAQQAEALRRAAMNAYKILYVAPERLDTPAFREFAWKAKISLVAVDEAHCVSQWGQDFRPSYLKIAGFMEELPVRPPVGAFTATATPTVREDIVRLLRLEAPRIVLTGFDRPNLRFVSQKPKDKYAALLRILTRHDGESGVVYCATRKTVEEVFARLSQDGYSAACYHAGMADADRRRNQDDFQYDRALIMVATNAFGMGIDKSNVSFVVHYNMPKNLESYYQEAGRAGRDGSEAECVLLYSGQDVITARWLIGHAPENTELSEEERAQVRDLDLERLKQMTFYATSKKCLRAFILRYFGEEAMDRCENCSVCAGEPFEVQAEAPPKKRVSRSRQKRGKESDLMGKLKALRNFLAAQAGVPNYVVFTDATLRDMCEKCPQDEEAFLEVSGVGEVKRARYGAAFLEVLRGEAASIGTIPDSPREKRAAPGKTSAYAPWTQAEDDQLRSEFAQGFSQKRMAELHRRTPGAIKMRLIKLELME